MRSLHAARRSAAALPVLLLLAVVVALLLAPMAGATAPSSMAPADGGAAAGSTAPSYDRLGLAETQTRYQATTTIGASGKILIVQDAAPWGYSANERAISFFRGKYDIVSSSDLASMSLTPYRAVLYASSTLGGSEAATYYANLEANVAKVEAYVHAGGTLLAHMAPWVDPSTAGHVLPANVRLVYAEADEMSIDVPKDGVASGQPRGVATLSASYLDMWSSSTHGYLTALPFNAKTVVSIATGDDLGRPVYVVYPYGKGTVRATMMTIEWAFQHGLANAPEYPNLIRPAVLLNEIATVLPRPVFGMQRNAWRFRNGGDVKITDDLDPWIAVFGDSVESLGAQQYLTQLASSAGRTSLYAGGHSFGMAATAGAYMTNYRTFDDVGIAGKATPWSWGTWGAANIFNGTRTTGTALQLRQEIQKYQVAYYDSAVQDELWGNMLSKNGLTLPTRSAGSEEKLGIPLTYKQALGLWARDLTSQLRWGPQVMVLTKGKVSHAVLATKAVTTGTGTKKQTAVTVYDPNYPGVARVLTVKTGRASWSYSFTWRKGSRDLSMTMGSAYAGDGIGRISPATVTRAVKDQGSGLGGFTLIAPDM